MLSAELNKLNDLSKSLNYQDNVEHGTHQTKSMLTDSKCTWRGTYTNKYTPCLP